MDLDILDVAIFDGDALRPENRVSIRDGIITEIGTGPAQSPADQVITATGRLLTPGFVDAHVHTTFGGQEALACDVSSANGLTETLDLIREYVAGTSPAPTANAEGAAAPEAAGADTTSLANDWVIGGGWSMADFPGGSPSADILDEACPYRPAILLSADHHSAWVNTKAMAAAGLDETSTAPDGGVIVTDSSGRPTGCLHESAIDLVSTHVPPASDAEVHAGLREGQRYLNALGVTAWMDAIVGDYGGHRDPYATYVGAAESGELHSEVVGSLWWPRGVEDIDAEVARLTELARTDGRFRATSVKFMLDGIVESRTAAMSTEYTCTCGGFGTSYFTKNHLEASFAALDRAGFDIHCHAIGDAAVKAALDAFEAVRSQGTAGTGTTSTADTGERRHHIAHVQVVDPADVPRFAELGITANLQALWACYDEQMIDLNLPFLGAERSDWLYPFGSLNRSGTHLAMGSDWPVSTANPWDAIHVALNRSHPTAADQSPLLPDEAIDLTTALRAYTAGSAHLLRSADNGHIRPGQPANLALASANPFTLPPTDIAGITNDLTICDGRIVHDALPPHTPAPTPPSAPTTTGSAS